MNRATRRDAREWARGRNASAWWTTRFVDGRARGDAGRARGRTRGGKRKIWSTGRSRGARRTEAGRDGTGATRGTIERAREGRARDGRDGEKGEGNARDGGTDDATTTRATQVRTVSCTCRAAS